MDPLLDDFDLAQEATLECQEKLSFDTPAQAETAAAVAAYQHGVKLKVYQCDNCGLWHLSSA